MIRLLYNREKPYDDCICIELETDEIEEQMEAFYDSKIEPFLVALSLELQRKVFSECQNRQCSY